MDSPDPSRKYLSSTTGATAFPPRDKKLDTTGSEMSRTDLPGGEEARFLEGQVRGVVGRASWAVYDGYAAVTVAPHTRPSKPQGGSPARRPALPGDER